jgi:NADH-quinone oxidoreductase subunit N
MDALIVLFASGLITLFSAFTKKPLVVITSALLGLGLTLALIACHYCTGHNYIDLDYEGLKFTKTSSLFSFTAVAITFMLVALGYQRFKENTEHTGEYIGLLIFSACGAIVMFTFTDMFMFFIGLEILSIPIYVMAGSNKDDLRSNEASLKYFLLGSFATGLLLFGIAWVYGATGSFSIHEIQQAVENGDLQSLGILMIGVLLILASFLFKVGAAPFHFWSPDVYDGAPHAVTGFMATVVKLAAFGAFMKIFHSAFSSTILSDFWGPIVAVLIVLTLFIGNLSALRQTGFKRLLAYSSITHAGYTLLVILTMGFNSMSDLWFYMTAYGCSVVVVIALGLAVNDYDDKIESLKGLLYRNPFLGVTGIIAILSLAGVPPTAGFFGKYMVFSSASGQYMWLVVIALINSGIGIFYYLKLITVIATKPESAQPKLVISPLTVLVVSIATLGTLGLAFLVNYLNFAVVG